MGHLPDALATQVELRLVAEVLRLLVVVAFNVYFRSHLHAREQAVMRQDLGWASLRRSVIYGV